MVSSGTAILGSGTSIQPSYVAGVSSGLLNLLLLSSTWVLPSVLECLHWGGATPSAAQIDGKNHI